MKILIVNGPNLNLLGERETNLYGDKPFESYLNGLRDHFVEITIEYFQSNWEGEIIDKLHAAAVIYDGIILNAAAYTHTSVAIADAVKAIVIPVVEVHITNILNREEYRHTSLIAPGCVGSITGFGLDSYRLGIESFRSKKK
ncbi:MAG: 3-dehydroquinate dehydratase [Bacteroidetes bacterium]|jgi:3-dehydroquinate dehydratase II|nr:3-dehydroquinate dehydratase [Bacteroidota bacterium]MBT3751289.1 3-dehydroquinate dehydratase [Bacteroidota bacterium]MBT4400794.1 3-dehydroquinate dehydratase [Bacteroidota bacterium]MBT4410998.1 3-dehydroquinate dehydratase [Bacteroidota bacterium]MBT5427407.1 3-dehydroquinate dehydratase [Bacteroidota bacterium]